MKQMLCLLLFLLLGINITMAQSKDEKTKTEIRQVMDEQAVAWNKGDIDGFMKGYWNSPELTFVSGSDVTKGWQPTLDHYKKSYDSKAKMGVLSFSDLQITIL